MINKDQPLRSTSLRYVLAPESGTVSGTVSETLLKDPYNQGCESRPKTYSDFKQNPDPTQPSLKNVNTKYLLLHYRYQSSRYRYLIRIIFRMKFIWPCLLPVHIKDPDPVYTYLFSWVWIRAIRTKSATLLNINYKTTANLCEYQLLTSTCSREFWMQYRLWMIFLMGSSSSSSSSSWIAASSSSWACRASASRPDSVHDWTCSSCTRQITDTGKLSVTLGWLKI